MPANQFAVVGKGLVALHDACAPARTGLIGHIGMLREQQGSATVSDGEIGPVEWAVFALHQAVLKLPLTHPLDEVEGPRAKLNPGVRALMTLAERVKTIPVIGMR
jgi:hypothetical protein